MLRPGIQDHFRFHGCLAATCFSRPTKQCAGVELSGLVRYGLHDRRRSLGGGSIIFDSMLPVGSVVAVRERPC